MKHLRVVVALALALTAVAGFGCTGQRSRDLQTSSIEPGVVSSPVAKGEMTYGSGDGGSPALGAPDSAQSAVTGSQADRMVIRNGSIEMRVDDTQEAVARVRAAVKAHQGEISDMSLSGGDGGVIAEGVRTDSAMPSPSSATITIRVAAEKLDALTVALAKLGTVTSQTESASDVTEQAIDMEARIKNLRAEESRLRTFLSRTNKVSELLAVEAQLARVRGEIESMDAQLTFLKRQSARATLVVTLSQLAPVTGSDSPWYGLREAFSQGVQGAIALVEMLVTAVVALTPLLVVAGIVIFAVTAPVRRRRRLLAAQQAETAGEDDDSEDTEAE